MEIIVFLVAAIVVGLIVYVNYIKKDVPADVVATDQAEQAPYKVEVPAAVVAEIVEAAPVVVETVVVETVEAAPVAEKPKRKPAARTAAPKKAAAKKPAAPKKAAAKKPAAKKKSA